MNQKKSKAIRRAVADTMPAANTQDRLIEIKSPHPESQSITLQWHWSTQRAIYQKAKGLFKNGPILDISRSVARVCSYSH